MKAILRGILGLAALFALAFAFAHGARSMVRDVLGPPRSEVAR